MAQTSCPTASTLLRWRLLRWSLQLFVGGIIFGSALGKSLDFQGFVDILQTYQAFPYSMLGFIGYIVIIVEYVLGIWILFGYQLFVGAVLAGLMNTMYALWMIITLLRGLDLPNCGCFGVFFPQPLTWLSPIEDLVLVALCALLVYMAKGKSTA